MAGKLRILAVCGFGIGTSLFLKMNIEDVLKKNSIDAEVINADIATAASIPSDIVVSSEGLKSQLEGKIEVPIIIISNFMNKSEIEEKCIPAIKDFYD